MSYVFGPVSILSLKSPISLFFRHHIHMFYLHMSSHLHKKLAWLPKPLMSKAGLRRTSTSSPSWISKFLVIVLRLLFFTPDACLPSTKTIDKNLDVHKDHKDGNERLKDPGRHGRRHPEEPWSKASY